VGTNNAVVNELVCTMANAELKGLREAFERAYDGNLVDRIRSELSGEHEKLIVDLIVKGRKEAPVDAAEAATQAEELFQTIKNGSSMMGGLSDKAERRIIDIIRTASAAQCQAIKVGKKLILR
jgi:hypothetical protein